MVKNDCQPSAKILHVFVHKTVFKYTKLIFSNVLSKVFGFFCWCIYTNIIEEFFFVIGSVPKEM